MGQILEELIGPILMHLEQAGLKVKQGGGSGGGRLGGAVGLARVKARGSTDHTVIMDSESEAGVRR